MPICRRRIAWPNGKPNQCESDQLLCGWRPEFFDYQRDQNKKGVEDPNTQGRSPIGKSRARHVSITYLHDKENDSETDHSPLANCRHDIA